jgi:hypothetical protein
VVELSLEHPAIRPSDTSEVIPKQFLVSIFSSFKMGGGLFFEKIDCLMHCYMQKSDLIKKTENEKRNKMPRSEQNAPKYAIEGVYSE